MMKIAVFMHCIVSGQNMPKDRTAWNVLLEQMAALTGSGLAGGADEIHFCVSGTDALDVATIAPAKSQVHSQPDKQDGERPTIEFLAAWVKQHPDWAVCYHHMKGSSLAGDPYHKWRRCMERAVIWNWRACVNDLINGTETVGAHWIDPWKSPAPNRTGYWGGNFWWANSNYLRRLPPLPDQPAINGKCYWAELWIGLSGKRPLLRDYCPHWPQKGCL